MSPVRQVGGAIRPSPKLFAKLPRFKDHFDRGAITSYPRPGRWADLDPNGNRYPIDGNAEDGDCVSAGKAHTVESQSRRVGPPFIDNIIIGSEAVSAYWTECAKQGYTGAQTPPGPGLDPVQAYVDWAPGYPVAGQNEVAWEASFELDDGELLEWLMWQARGVGIALELANTWQADYEKPGPWGVGGPANPQNGHWVLGCGYEPNNGKLLATWGDLRWTTPEFILTYGQYGIVSVPTSWEALPGVDAEGLIAEFQAATGVKPLSPSTT